MARDPVLAGSVLMTFEAHKDHVKGVIDLNHIGFGPSTIGLVFVSPEHMMELFGAMMEKACDVWPNHPMILSYLEDGSNEVDT